MQTIKLGISMDHFFSIFIICSIILGILLFGLCLKVIFKKGGTFPTGHVADSKELTNLGVTCAKSQDKEAQEGV